MEEAVEVQILRELVYKVVAIADVDEGTGVGELGILEVEVRLDLVRVLDVGAADLVRVLDVGVAADAVGLLQLNKHTRALDVLEVHDGVPEKLTTAPR